MSSESPDDARGERLLDAVFANPASDAARAVYADWLLESGDAHGAFIQAQLEGRRVDGEGPLGDSAGVVRAPVFERGFVRRAVLEPFRRVPRWLATLEDAVVGPGCAVGALPALKSLTVVGWDTLLEHAALSVTHLTVWVREGEGVRERIPDGAYASVETLRVAGEVNPHRLGVVAFELLSSGAFPGVRRLRMHVPHLEAQTWTRAAVARGLAEIETLGAMWHVHDGAPEDVEPTALPWTSVTADALRARPPLEWAHLVTVVGRFSESWYLVQDDVRGFHAVQVVAGSLMGDAPPRQERVIALEGGSLRVCRPLRGISAAAFLETVRRRPLSVILGFADALLAAGWVADPEHHQVLPDGEVLRASGVQLQSRTTGSGAGWPERMQFVAPEILFGAEPDDASWVYAVAVMIWVAATGGTWGRVPVRKPRFDAYVRGRLDEAQGLPPALRDVLESALCWTAAQRVPLVTLRARLRDIAGSAAPYRAHAGEVTIRREGPGPWGSQPLSERPAPATWQGWVALRNA